MERPTDAAPEGGAAQPGDRRPRLARPPSERYTAATAEPALAASPATATTPARRAFRGLLAALAGALIVAVLGGPLSVTAGLLIVAAGIGWAVGTLVRTATVLAVGLSVGAVGIGLIGIWLYARSEGGVLGPLDYITQVQGLLAPVEIGVAGGVAALTARRAR